MCIRDRPLVAGGGVDPIRGVAHTQARVAPLLDVRGGPTPCLLYTTDAADERSSVDLGGRRIIKKKPTETHE